MAYQMAWKVYGADGHRQAESFGVSEVMNFSRTGDPRILEIERQDKTGTNDFVIFRVTAATKALCEEELDGQISDGIFENSRVGYTEVIDARRVSLKDVEGDQEDLTPVTGITTKTFSFRHRGIRFYVDLVDDGECFNFWLNAENYGIKDYVYGVPKYQPSMGTTYTEKMALDIVKGTMYDDADFYLEEHPELLD